MDLYLNEKFADNGEYSHTEVGDKKTGKKLFTFLSMDMKNKRELLINFLDSLREYVRESDTNIARDGRESSELVDIYLRDQDDISTK